MTTTNKETFDAARKLEKQEAAKQEKATTKHEEEAAAKKEAAKQDEATPQKEKAPKTDNAGNLLNSKGDIVDENGDVRYFAGTYAKENGSNVDLYKRRITPDQPRKAPNPAEGA